MIEPAAEDRSRTSRQPDRREPAASMIEWPMRFGSGESSPDSGGFARSASTSPTRPSDLAADERSRRGANARRAALCQDVSDNDTHFQRLDGQSSRILLDLVAERRATTQMAGSVCLDFFEVRT